MTDLISRQAAIDALKETDDVGVCWKGGSIQRHSDFEEAINCIKELPSVHLQRTCVNCGRTANNGGLYEDGRTRCPIEEHYALPKDGYCHLWEKRNVWEE